MNYPFFILWVFALPRLPPHTSRLCTIWSCVVVVCKIIYQLKFVKPQGYVSNCTEVRFLVTQMDFKDHHFTLILQNHLIILGLTAMEMTVYRHQFFYRVQNQLTPPMAGVIFDSITWEHLDDGLLSCVKYFVSYSFYKFGLEMCLIAAINVIQHRVDFYALLHVRWIIYLLWSQRRKAVAEVWPRYCCFLATVMAFQCLVCLGLPPAFCKDYLWRTSRWSIHSNLIKWLYLLDFEKRPDASFLLYDFVLLLSASLQWQVFENKNKACVRKQAGDNVEISHDLDLAALSQYSPVPNFIYCRSYLDMVKVVVFNCHFWFVLCLIFTTGTTRISIFCLGYLIACFYFILFGNSLLLKPVKNILRLWDYLIAYIILVIEMKNLLSIYIFFLNHCWLIQTFGVFCTVPGYDFGNRNSLGCNMLHFPASTVKDLHKLLLPLCGGRSEGHQDLSFQVFLQDAGLRKFKPVLSKAESS
uniref:Piezo TM25-28 domain-containing protein n=1 Tax=Apteryx owenii TaxID=8824 RepID=A0A8B9S359_APTOW